MKTRRFDVGTDDTLQYSRQRPEGVRAPACIFDAVLSSRSFAITRWGHCKRSSWAWPLRVRTRCYGFEAVRPASLGYDSTSNKSHSLKKWNRKYRKKSAAHDPDAQATLTITAVTVAENGLAISSKRFAGQYHSRSVRFGTRISGLDSKLLGESWPTLIAMCEPPT